MAGTEAEERGGGRGEGGREKGKFLYIRPINSLFAPLTNLFASLFFISPRNAWYLGSPLQSTLCIRRFHSRGQLCELTGTKESVISRWSMIVSVIVVLNRTNVDSDWHFDTLCGSHLQSQSESYHVSRWHETLIIDLIGQLSRDFIGRLSVKPHVIGYEDS